MHQDSVQIANGMTIIAGQSKGLQGEDAQGSCSADLWHPGLLERHESPLVV